MSLTDRILNPDRRTDEVQPLIERRNGDERRLPRWVQRARDGALYGYDEAGQPIAAKLFYGRAA